MKLTEKQQNDLSYLVSNALPEKFGFILIYGGRSEDVEMMSNMPREIVPILLSLFSSKASIYRSETQESLKKAAEAKVQE